MKRLLVLALLCVLFQTCRKDETHYTISGRIFDVTTGRGIDSVLFRVYTFNEGSTINQPYSREHGSAYSNSEGYYTISYPGAKRGEERVFLGLNSHKRTGPHIDKNVDAPRNQNATVNMPIGGFLRITVLPTSTWGDWKDDSIHIYVSDFAPRHLTVKPVNGKISLPAIPVGFEYASIEYGNEPYGKDTAETRKKYKYKSVKMSGEVSVEIP